MLLKRASVALTIACFFCVVSSRAQDFYIMDTLSAPPLFIETSRIILDLNTCDLSTTTTDFNLSILPFRPIDMTATGEVGINIPVSMWIDYDETVNNFPEDVIAYSYWTPFATSGVGPPFAPETSPKGLATDYNFESYLVGDYLSHIDDADDIVTPLGLLPASQRPKGQMTYREGSFYYPSINDEWMQLKVSGANYWIRSLGSLPDSLNYGGVFSIPYSCDSTDTYVIHHDPNVGSTLYHLAIPSLTLTQHCTMPYKPSAAAFVGENTLPPCVPLVLDLNLNDDTNLNRQDSICSGTIFPLDEHTQLSPDLEYDSLVVTLQNALDAPNEAIGVSAAHPEVLLDVASTTQLTLASTGFTKAGPLLEVLASLSYTNDAPVPSLGQRIIEITAYHPHYGTTSASIFIEVANEGSQQVIPILTAPSCYGESNGMIDLSLASMDTFQVVWEDGSDQLPHNGLGSGTYRYVVTDQAGCTYDEDLVLNQPDTLTVSISAAQDSICGDNGALTALPQGGTPGYTYEWSNASTDETINALPAGTYSLILRDANDCAAIAEYTLYPAASVSGTFAETECLGTPISLNGQAYTQDTTFQQILSSTEGCDSLVDVQLSFLDTFYTFSAYTLCPGESIDIYNQTIEQDTNFILLLQTEQGCDSIEQYLVSFTPPIVNTMEASLCEGESYSFAGAQLSQTGVYYDTLTANSGCDSLVALNLTAHPLPIIEINQQGSLCNGSEALLDIGTEYGNIVWSTGSTQNNLLVTSIGTYIVTATDANGCTSSASISITDEPPSVDFQVENPACSNGEGQLELINISGGIPPYQLQPGGQQVAAGDLLSGLAIGSYDYALEDATGCATPVNFQIIAENELQVELPAELTIKLGESVSIPVTSSVMPSLISWTPPDGLDCTDCLTPTASPATTTRYFLYLEDANNCDWEGQVLVRVEAAGLYVPNAFSPNGDGLNDAFRPELNGAVAAVISFSVYDRWGAEVFVASATQSEWSGLIKGQPAPSGVYVYFIEWVDLAGNLRLENGEVTLLR